MRMPLTVCTFACVLGLALPARAQGVALSRFEPAPRGSRFFYADSLELGRVDPIDTRPVIAAGLAMSWASKLNTWGDLQQGKRDTLVRNTWEVHPGASVALAPGARFALEVPVTLSQRGESTNLAGTRFPQPTTPALGDIRANVDLRFLGPTTRDVEGVTLAGGVTAWIPTGTSAAYTSDDFVRFGAHVGSAARFRWLLLSARVGYMYRRDGYLGGSRVGPEVNGVIGIAAMFKHVVIGPELVASSAIDSEFAKRATPVELVLGSHSDIGPVRLGGAVSFAIVPGMGSANVRSVFTIEWLGPDIGTLRDRDHDRVPDSEDLCPDLAGEPALQGCPAGSAEPTDPALVPPVELAPAPPPAPAPASDPPPPPAP